MGSANNQPAMQVVGNWHVTNITDGAVRILRAKIIPPGIEGTVLARHPRGNIYGSYEIWPRATNEVSSSFWIRPPIREEGKDFRATVYLIDQFGNEHKIGNQIFEGRSAKESEPGMVVVEALHAISDLVEKEVAAVLKSEIVRYREFGRREGGLGSIRTFTPGGDQRGLAMGWRSSDSSLEQRISNTVRQTGLASDNAQSLLALYQGLKTEAERNRFTAALLKRLSKGAEYAPVGYLILFVLFQVGRLLEGMKVARRALYGDPAHGFSDSLRLVDALLYFEHPSFTSDDLDEIERTIEGIDDGFVGQIREKISAIRAFRLRQIVR